MIAGTFSLQNEREAMRVAEQQIEGALASESPGSAASNLVNQFNGFGTQAERVAFVAALSARVAIGRFISSASI